MYHTPTSVTFSSYHGKRESELSCIYEHFCLFENYFHFPQLFPLQFEDYIFLFPLLGYLVSRSPFSFSWKKTRVTYEGDRKKSKLVQKVLAVMLHSEYSAESL